MSHPDTRSMLRSSLLALGLGLLLTACPDRSDQNSSSGNTGSDSGTVTVRFLDVGQGDSVLITSPEGKHLIYDGGKSADRLEKQLEALSIERIEVVVGSHGDADHIAGLRAAAAYKPKFLIYNGIDPGTTVFEKMIDALSAVGTKASVARDQTVNLGSLAIQIIPPPRGMPDDEQNVNSIGLTFTWGGQKVLMTGDSETPETRAWLEQRPDDFRNAAFYKSIHHGAKNGDSRAWLEVVKPRNVFIGVGNNNYGHPTREALTLYEDFGAKVYRTDLNGTITLTLEGDGTATVRSERNDKRRASRPKS